jgi:hypothetical protein
MLPLPVMLIHYDTVNICTRVSQHHLKASLTVMLATMNAHVQCDAPRTADVATARKMLHCFAD